MKLEPKNIVKIDTSAFRTIHVELASDIDPESFIELPTFEIRDGLRTKIYRPHHRKDTLVTVSWLDLESPDELVFHVFSHFGKMKSNIQWCKMKQENDESEEAKLLNSILCGERQFWIELDKPLPSYTSIDGRKVKIYHAGLKRPCARCQKDGESCVGRANARLCDENGGQKLNVEFAWKDILNSVGYKEWNGGELTDDDVIKKKFDDENATSNEIWKTASSVLGSFRSSFPSQVMIFGKLVTKPILLATGMNEFFVKKIADLKRNVTENDAEAANDILKMFLSRKEIPPEGFKLKEITTEQMNKLIKGLKGKKSCGLDWICGFSLKIAAPALAEELKFLTNVSIRTSRFPTGWKFTKVLPGFKNKGSRFEANSYRSISNLSEISKLTERAVHSQVYEYFEKSSLFHPNHHGFLKNHSTATSIQQIFDFWMKALDEGKLTGTLLLDLSAGFDVIDFDILLEKMEHYGFQQETVSWFSSYLKGRSQCVQIESAFSPFLPIKWGVPQGFILGPLIFLIFINELPAVAEDLEEASKNSTIVVFADDNTPMLKNENPDKLKEELEAQVLKITTWFQANRMVVSGDKTKFLVIGTSSNRTSKIGNRKLKITVGGHETEESDDEKLLGI